MANVRLYILLAVSTIWSAVGQRFVATIDDSDRDNCDMLEEADMSLLQTGLNVMQTLAHDRPQPVAHEDSQKLDAYIRKGLVLARKWLGSCCWGCTLIWKLGASRSHTYQKLAVDAHKGTDVARRSMRAKHEMRNDQSDSRDASPSHTGAFEEHSSHKQSNSSHKHSSHKQREQEMPQADAADAADAATSFFQTDMQQADAPRHRQKLLRLFDDSLDSAVVVPVASMMLCSVLWAVWLYKFRRRRLDTGCNGLLADAVSKSSGLPLVSVENAPPTQWTARMFSMPVQEPFGLSVDTAEGIELKAAW